MKSGTSLHPADVVLIEFPFSELTSSKRRPVLVVTQSDSLGDFSCLAITSKEPQRDAIKMDHNDMKSGMLPKASWVRYDKIFTLNISLVRHNIGSLTQDKHKEVMSRFCEFFQCNR